MTTEGHPADQKAGVKWGGDCEYSHSDKICDQFLTNGICSEPKLCLLRHPKECKFWLGDARGCLI